MYTRTLTQLLAEIRSVSDTEGLTARHPDADLTRALNASIRSLRGLVTSRGGAYFIEATSPTTLAGTQVSGEVYSEVPWPSTAVQVLGVDVESATGLGDWRSLRPIGWVQRRDRQRTATVTGNLPYEFAVRQIPSSSTSSVTAGTISLFPHATSGRYKIWFLPDWVDLATGTDVFTGLPDWHQWVVQDVVELVAQRDDVQRETYAIAVRRKAEAEARLVESLGRVVSAGPLRPRRSGRGFRSS